MECSVCYETILYPYSLKSCTHEICMKCYRHIKKTSPEVFPFRVDTVKVVPIQCPLCRKKEDISLNPSDYPVEYKQYLELIINETPCGMSWYSVHTEGPTMREWKTNLKYASTKVGRHRFKRIGRRSIH